MVTEFAQIEVKPGLEEAFIEGAAKSRPVFLAAEGCFGMGLQRSVEAPTKFLLMVQWESVDAHMVTFRESPAFRNGATMSAIASRHRRWSGTAKPWSRRLFQDFIRKTCLN